jgi:hypothetical protein
MADSAFATFATAMTRARYLLKLYHGLTNTRQRGIRTDWAEKFCDLMHWPQTASIARVDSTDVVIVIRDGADMTCADFDHDQLTDLLRASLVMGVSAMDAYFHSKICAYIVKAANRGDKMPNALKKANMTVLDFISAKKYKRKMQALRNALERTLGYQSLQQAKNIEDALGLIGITKYWSSIAARIGTPIEDLKKKLVQYVKRRNQIAHEGDLSKSKKARNQPHELKPNKVVEALDFFDKLVTHSEREIDQQLTNIGLK